MIDDCQNLARKVKNVFYVDRQYTVAVLQLPYSCSCLLIAIGRKTVDDVHVTTSCRLKSEEKSTMLTMNSQCFNRGAGDVPDRNFVDRQPLLTKPFHWSSEKLSRL